jgi:hypothetical protein
MYSGNWKERAERSSRTACIGGKVDIFFQQSGVLNRGAEFESADGWGSGFVLARRDGAGNGVIVGPGLDNPNIFAQDMDVLPGAVYSITARAMSVGGVRTKAAVQINWLDDGVHVVGVDQQQFDVYPFPVSHRLVVHAPLSAKWGTLYVVPGQPRTAVRYLEMSFREVSTIERFMTSSLFGLPAISLLTHALVFGCLAVFYLIYRIFWARRVRPSGPASP